jgi:hypothetical protein
MIASFFWDVTPQTGVSKVGCMEKESDAGATTLLPALPQMVLRTRPCENHHAQNILVFRTIICQTHQACCAYRLYGTRRDNSWPKMFKIFNKLFSTGYSASGKRSFDS